MGIGPGNPLYDDMEGYSPGRTNTTPVLTFLRAWTTQLHAEGYLSGVYSSGDSGIVDLVKQVGTAYREPDELWVARWNGVASTADPNVPASYWPVHERLHQDQGDQNKTYGHARLSIDSDFVDAATAASGSARGAQATPDPLSPPTISGANVDGRGLILWHGGWSGVPTSHTYQWEDCDDAGANCTPIPGAVRQRYVLKTTDIGHKLRVVETATNSHGTSVASISAASEQILNPTPLYWLLTAYGNVYPSPGTAFYGSPRTRGFEGNSVTGATATWDHRGYWVVDRAGTVFPFGDAAKSQAVHHSARIRGIVSAPHSGYWLFTSSGNVFPGPGTPWYSSPYHAGFRGSSIVGMATTKDGRGYWLVTSTGTVYPFGDAATLPAIHSPRAIRGIVAAPASGYWLYTRHGQVYPSHGTPFYGSPHRHGFRGSTITGMSATKDGEGYWVVNSSGSVLSFGDAPKLGPIRHKHPINGMLR